MDRLWFIMGGQLWKRGSNTGLQSLYPYLGQVTGATGAGAGASAGACEGAGAGAGSAASGHSSAALAWTPSTPRAYAQRLGRTPLVGLRPMPGPHHGRLPPPSPVDHLWIASAPFTTRVGLVLAVHRFLIFPLVSPVSQMVSKKSYRCHQMWETGTVTPRIWDYGPPDGRVWAKTGHIFFYPATKCERPARSPHVFGIMDHQMGECGQKQGTFF